jgi:two-component system, cell cycle sensor histidine kinase and response regulator CckA
MHPLHQPPLRELFRPVNPDRMASADNRQMTLVGLCAADNGVHANELTRAGELTSSELSPVLFRILWERSTDALRLTDRAGRMVAMNAAFCALVEIPADQLLGQPMERIFSPEGDPAARRKEYLSWFADGQERKIELQANLQCGRRADFEIQCSTVLTGGERMLLSVIRDNTARRLQEETRSALELRLLNAQKLESLGLLVGGIAHDFNNLLTGILGHVSLGMLNAPAKSPLRPTMQTIEASCRQAAELCKQVLSYARQSRPEARTVSLNQLIRETRPLLQISTGKRGNLSFRLDPETPLVAGDAVQLCQILMNLVINASDALEDRGGFINVTTGLVDADASYLSEGFLPTRLEPGRYAFLEVSDNGVGMTAEVKRKIFEPFFSTKPKGCGLGLAAVLGIAQSHGGAIKVYTESGVGSSFKLLLPAASNPVEGAFTPAPPAQLWQGSGPVLIADDEDGVLHVVAQMVEALGFTPLCARNACEAVEIFELRCGQLQLALLDLTMPGASCEESIVHFHSKDPSLPVILMSGYNEAEALQRVSRSGLAGFLQKPFTLDELSRRLRQALEARPIPQRN